MQSIHAHPQPPRIPWNKGKLVGQKSPFKLKDIWAIRVRLQLAHRTREALLNHALDSKLRGCDLVRLRVQDVRHGERVANRAIVLQQKTQRPVQFEITEMTRAAIAAWIEEGQALGDGSPLPESTPAFASFVSTTVRPDSQWLGEGDRIRQSPVRYSLDAPHQSGADLPAHEESDCTVLADAVKRAFA